MKIYLDVCCLNRPFDDQSQGRIRLEAEAVVLILEQVKRQNWQWVGSTVVTMEVDRTPDLDRRRQIQLILDDCDTWVSVDSTASRRAREIETLGFSPFDALHIACAEQGEAVVFLTTDDRLLKLATRYADRLNILVENPAIWLVEVFADDEISNNG